MSPEPFDPTTFTRADWPERARVRGVAPIGVGTAWVESASGILVATAAENRLAVRPFIEHVLADALDGTDIDMSPEEIAALGHDLVRKPAASINGGGITARTWTRVLASATLQPGLARGTTIAWAERFSSRGALRANRAFCPACLWDWTQGDRPVPATRLWEPLRWQFRALAACPIHAVRLREACPTPGCGRVRTVIAGWASTEVCVGCRRPFARSAEEIRPTEAPLTADELDWAAFVDAELGDILARPPAAPATAEARFSEILAVALESVTAGAQHAFAERIGMTEATVSYWKSGTRTPTIDALLRVCRAAGFRLRDVLLGDLAAVRAGAAPSVAPYVAPSTETHHVLDEAEMERVLQDALVADPPPALKSIYADTRVNATHVRRRFPALCAAVRERHAEWEKAQRDARREDKARRIREAVAALSERDIYPARNQVGKVVPAVWLRSDEFKAAWHDAVIAEGWTDPCDLVRVKGAPMPVPTRRRMTV